MEGVQAGPLHVRWSDGRLWVTTPTGQEVLAAREAALLREYLNLIADLESEESEKEERAEEGRD